LFATHYHELTELEGKLPGVKNYRILVNEVGDKVVFLHRIARGGTNKSFGIEVAALAGVPADVCARAKDIATKLEKRQFTDTDSIVEDTIGGSNYAQMSLFDQPDDSTKEIMNILRETNVERMTPVQAMLVLADLIERAKHE
ncbi:MAG: DNA mismatch repair protein MutS, partial [Clostridia bacterium]|nr:DNA mismatch repair protein MutS [Clostridia bacterium]